MASQLINLSQFEKGTLTELIPKNIIYAHDNAYYEDRRVLENYLVRRKILFEEKPLPVEVCPYLISEDIDVRLQITFEKFHNIIEKIIDLYLSQKDVRNFFKFSAAHDELISLQYAYHPRIHFCRFDFTFNKNNEPIIYETNAACPGGLLLMKLIYQGFQETQVFKKLRQLGNLKG